MKWRKIPEEKLRVEAWPKTKQLASVGETRRPSFVIGYVRGHKSLMISQLGSEVVGKYPSTLKNGTIKLEFPIDNLEAIADAYRIGLAAAVVSEAQSRKTAEAALKYLQHVQREEVWFWTSKLLHVLGEGLDPAKVVKALSIISGG